MKTPVRIAHTLLLTLLVVVGARAQGHDSQGTEFWVAFLENFGSGGSFEQSDLRLYASCDTVTTIRLLYHATAQERVVQITKANTPIEIDVRALFGDVEIAGGEERSGKSIVVRSDDEITLYGVNVRMMSSDAFLALPADIYTRRYVVLAYQNGIASDAQGFFEIDMPSQFCVIATEDGTTVRVNPSAPIAGRGATPFTVGLDRGEVYFAQARLDDEWDLSGTTVQTTKPVAVFAGVRRTAIPARIGNFRDHLIEQMPPIEVWGREAIVTPHFPVTAASREVAVIRVLAAVDNTRWYIDGVRQPPLSRTRAVELPMTRAMRITADRPIMVAQYEHSVNASDSLRDEFELGDPFMMLVPPPEQFDTSYSFQSVGHSEFLRHFVNIIIPREGLASLRLDGMPVGGAFVPIAGSAFGYMQYELDPGAHFIRSDSAFGLFAYGFGRANSYGYTGGMAFRKLVHDFEPPLLEQQVECGRLTGLIIDDRITDSGIDSCYALAQCSNVNVVVDRFVSAADTVFFRADLVDRYRDGVVAIRAVDSAGRSRTQVTPMAGFTVRVPGAGDDGTFAFDTVRIFNGGSRCGELEVVNDGLFEQVITSIGFSPNATSIAVTTTMPLRLLPGERAIVRYCASLQADTIVRTQVVIGNGCADRALGIVTIENITDTLDPEPLVERGECAGELVLRFVEPGRRSSGIVAIEFTRLVNCRVDWMIPKQITAPLGEIACRVSAIDPRYDAFVEGAVEDLVGNRLSFSDTIGGFTLAFVGREGDTLSTARGTEWQGQRLVFGDERCDTLTIVNYGSRAVRIARAHLGENLSISLPPSQSPMVLAPGERRALVICLDAGADAELTDTLTILDECGNLDRVPLIARVTMVTATATDRCNNALSIRSMGAAKRTFLSTPVPNPSAGGAVMIDLGLEQAAAVTLELFDADGRPAYAILRSEPLDAGLHRVVADLATLGSGRYFLRLSAGSDDVVEALVVVR